MIDTIASGSRYDPRRYALAMVASLLLVTATIAQAAPRPNIIVMLTDDQRWDAVGHVQREMGAKGRLPWLASATPNIDSLAAGGFRFRNAFVVSSLCSPSRAAFLTGSYNHLNGVANNHTPLPVASVTYASALRAAGYVTGYFGKWHMGAQAERPGFDESASYIGQGKFVDPTFVVNGTPRTVDGWVDDITTDFALDFVQRQVGHPFLAVIGYKSPHGPRLPPRRLAGLFPTANLKPPISGTSYPPYLVPAEPRRTSNDDVRKYSRTIVGVDENVGRVLAALRSLGLEQDTIVVFASDNGYLLDEHGLSDKRAAYEESIRIPLLLRYPSLGRRNVAIGGTVLNIDLAPTLLELAGAEIPTSIQGVSMVPLLRGTSRSIRGEFLYEYFHETDNAVPTIVTLRRSRYKLVTYPGQPSWTQLFDLRNDPSETRNLVNVSSAQATLRNMSSGLTTRKAAVGFVIPPYADPYP